MCDVIRLIKNKPAAIRTEQDLDLIRKTFDVDLSNTDAVWASLSRKQKNILCKYFEFKAALSEKGDLYPYFDKMGADAQNSIPAGLFILFHGNAVVSTGLHSIVIHGGDGIRVGRAVLGRLQLPEDANDFFVKAEETMRSKNTSLYHKFVSLEKGCKEVSVHFHRGASYLMLPESKSRIFIERLNASLLTRCVFRDIGVTELLDPNTANSDDSSKIWRFKPGNVLLQEGTVANRVLFIAKGSCFVFRRTCPKNPSQQLCVGSLTSPSFIGFAPLLIDCKTNGDSFGIQPVSVVAVQEGYAFSFCSRQFINVLKNTNPDTDLVNAFKYLADCQSIWTNAEDIDFSGEDKTEELNSTNQEACHMPVTEEVNVDDDKHHADIGINGLISNIECGKLKRKQLLESLHESLASYPNNKSILRNIHHPLLQSISKHLLKEIMTNLERECGVTFGRSEGDDPFHNFTIESNATEEHMALLIPRPDLDRLHRMADNFLGLGRKRPPKYDDSDPFLLPVPSAVDRKYHGKTLPIVRRA